LWLCDCLGSGGGVGLGLLLDMHRFAAVVPAAVLTGVMGALLLVAVRALFELWRGEGVVRAALALSRVRNAPLGDSHFSISPWVIGKRSEARVDRIFRVTVVCNGVQIDTADEAKAATVGSAEQRDGLGQRDCLAHRLAQVELVMVV